MSLVIEPFADLGVIRVSRWIFNCYVLYGEAGAVVVDAGMPDVADDLAPVLKDLDRPVTAIVATHAHSDHVAGASRLGEEQGAPVLLSTRALDYLGDVEPRTPSLAKVATIWRTFVDQPFDWSGLAGFVRGSSQAGFGARKGMLWSGPEPAGLAPGPLPGLPDWQVVAAPGHTDDSLVLWNQATGALVSGDAVLSDRGQARITRQVVDPVAALDTAGRLRQLPVTHLLPGHGRPVHDPESVWD